MLKNFGTPLKPRNHNPVFLATSHSAQIFPQYSLKSFRVSILLCKVLNSVLNTATTDVSLGAVQCVIFSVALTHQCFSIMYEFSRHITYTISPYFARIEISPQYCKNFQKYLFFPSNSSSPKLVLSHFILHPFQLHLSSI
jgi:hypothetical protein